MSELGPVQAIGVPVLLGGVGCVLSYVGSWMLLAGAGQLLFPELPGDQPIFVAALLAFLFAAAGGGAGLALGLRWVNGKRRD